VHAHPGVAAGKPVSGGTAPGLPSHRHVRRSARTTDRGRDRTCAPASPSSPPGPGSRWFWCLRRLGAGCAACA